MATVFYSIKEEIANAITHGLGACLSVVALIILIIAASVHGNAWHIVSFSIFGSTLVILYTSSTLYHSLTHKKAKQLFRKFDHISIFLLIAGTYTPFCLLALNGWIGWTVLGIVWGCAAAGIVFKSIAVGSLEMLSTLLYVVMGWIIIIAIKPLHDTLSSTGFALLVAGGACYTAGTIFFVYDKIKYFHGIWHIFVLGGSIFHFFSVMTLLK